MKLPDSVPMESGSFLTIRDPWRTEWEVGVQVGTKNCRWFRDILCFYHKCLGERVDCCHVHSEGEARSVVAEVVWIDSHFEVPLHPVPSSSRCCVNCGSHYFFLSCAPSTRVFCQIPKMKD